MTTIETIHPGKTCRGNSRSGIDHQLTQTFGADSRHLLSAGRHRRRILQKVYLDPRVSMSPMMRQPLLEICSRIPLLSASGCAAHMMNAVFFILTAMTLSAKHVNKTVARTMLVFVALSAGITTLNAVFQFVGLRIATDSTYATAFGVAADRMP